MILVLTTLLLPSRFFSNVITVPCTFEQLRSTDAGAELRNLVDHLSLNCTNPAIVNALLYATTLPDTLL